MAATGVTSISAYGAACNIKMTANQQANTITNGVTGSAEFFRIQVP